MSAQTNLLDNATEDANFERITETKTWPPKGVWGKQGGGSINQQTTVRTQVTDDPSINKLWRSKYSYLFLYMRSENPNNFVWRKLSGLTPGAKYKFSFWYKTPSPSAFTPEGHVKLGVVANESDITSSAINNPIQGIIQFGHVYPSQGVLSSEIEHKKISYTFQVPTGKTQVYVAFVKSADCDQQIYIDNMSLTIADVAVLKNIDVHPSLLYTQQELDDIKQAIAIHKEPFYSASLYLKMYCDAKLNYVSSPYTGNNSDLYYNQMLLPASIVRNMAMAYKLTGNADYGVKAATMLDEFATACTGKLFDINIDFPAQSMKVARASFPFVCAYDLLLNTGLISQATKTKVQAWFRQIEKQVKDGEQVWIDNDYFSKQYYNNHLVAHTMSLLAIGCALDDPALIQYAVDSEECPRDVRELITGMIMMTGDRDCVRITNQPKEAGEIMDRFRHVTDGGRGLQYASLVLNLFSPIARICTHHSWNLFNYTAPTGENLQLSYNYYSDYWRTKNSYIKSGFYGHPQEDLRLASPADWIGNFEVGLRYYPTSQQLINVVGSYNRSTQHIDLLGYTAFFAKP